MRMLGDILLSGKHITEGQLGTALICQKREGVRLGRWFVNHGIISEETLFDAICDQYDAVAFSERELVDIDGKVLENYDREALYEVKAIPLYVGSFYVVVATADPAMFSLEAENIFGDKKVLLALIPEDLFERVWADL